MVGRVSGKFALVTGAARGQGRSHALRLAEEGADIIAVDVCTDIDTVPYELASWEDLDLTAKEVEALDPRITLAQADVRDLGAMQAAVERGVAELGPIDIIVARSDLREVIPTR